VETLQPELEHRGRQTLHSDLGFCDKLNILEDSTVPLYQIDMDKLTDSTSFQWVTYHTIPYHTIGKYVFTQCCKAWFESDSLSIIIKLAAIFRNAQTFFASFS
jgi:hypothetical protein